MIEVSLRRRTLTEEKPMNDQIKLNEETPQHSAKGLKWTITSGKKSKFVSFKVFNSPDY